MIVEQLDIFVPLQPDPALNPNARGHWSKRHTASQMARGAAKYATVDALSRRSTAFPKDHAVEVSFVIQWGKGRRILDEDNALGALKPYIDGVADALERNDRTFLMKTPEQVRSPGTPGVLVTVRSVPSVR